MSPPNPNPAWLAPTRVTPPQRLAAAMRLMALAPGDKREAARRFLLAAPSIGVDPALMWITTDARGGIRELCLGAKGSGRTLTLMLAPELSSDAANRTEERTALIEAAVAGLSTELGRQVGLFQVLLSLAEAGAYEAFTRAGFSQIGELAYLRVALAGRPALPPTSPARGVSEQPRGAGVSPAQPSDQRHDFARPVHCSTIAPVIRPLSELGPPSQWRSMLVDLLNATYVDTLDCPGLCGLRETPDILDSHLAAGRWDPRYWWMIDVGEGPVGCALVNPSIDGASAELVYLGLAPEARGRRLGSALLEHALGALPARQVREVTCAVDRANEPALRVYAKAGFTEFGARLALVRAPLRDLQPGA